MSNLAQTFAVGNVQGGRYQRMDVTLTWDSALPMEFRLHMWQPDESTVIRRLSRDLLAEITAEDIGDVWHVGSSLVSATRVQASGLGFDSVYLHLVDAGGPMTLTFRTVPLAAFVRTSLAMCPTESEAVDVDGLIHQIFNAEEAS